MDESVKVDDSSLFGERDVLKDLHLLYVENDEAIRESLQKFLRRRVGLLSVAQNGQEGLEFFAQKKPDVVITDIRMPMMDGLSMSREIRKIDADVPILIITGHNDESFFLSAIDLNVDKYFKKPLDNKLLEKALLKIATNIRYKKQLEFKNTFINHILNVYPGFLMITNGVDISYLNASFLEFLGHDPSIEAPGHDIDIDSRMVAKEHSFYKNKTFHQWMAEMIKRPEFDYVIHMMDFHAHENDEPSIFLARLRKLECFTENEYLVSFTDVTLMETVRELFHELAIKDPLTKVFNRKKFYEELEREIARSRRYGKDLSVVMFDLDHFKEVNDVFGHQQGDRVLIEVVGLIREIVRKNDSIGRYGGEEFILFLPETPPEGAYCIAERIRDALFGHDFKLGRQVTASFGVATFNGEEDIDGLIRRADNALYVAKESGRNRVESAVEENEE